MAASAECGTNESVRSETSSTSGTGSRRGRPRSAEADESILRAAAELLGEHGYGALTIEAVAQRSGVAKTTIYRRWSDRPELVLATMAHLTATIVPPDNGSLRADLL